MVHFWPKMGGWLGDLPDTRVQEKVIYPRAFLVWMGLMAFLMKLGSRRQIGFELDSPEALENLNRLSGCRQETLAHHDTLNHFLGHVDPEALAALRRRMVHRLLRMKVLEGARLLGKPYLVALDATGQLFFHQRHCSQCLEKTIDGRTYYYHNILEAKLIGPGGIVLSVGSEFIENTDPHASKQDCELAAFRRLAPRLKKDFPQLPLCLLLDALYANGTGMGLCEDNGWHYIITFKEGSLPALWQEYQTLQDLCPDNRQATTQPDGTQQSFAWVDDLEHVDDEGRAHRTGAFQCREQAPDGTTGFFAWLTDLPIRPDTVAALGNQGGRKRWKIENEGFNTQKNGGFNLEHAYSLGDDQIKNFYLLLQIAHMILQLLERGSLLPADCKKLFGSIRNLAKRLAESLRNRLIPPEALDPLAASLIQIRLRGP